MTDYDVIIVGGGASGMACATTLNKNGKLKVALIEAGDRLGKKLAATGNGQGNVSNTNMTIEHYHGGNLNLVGRIACKNAYAGAQLFDCLFLPDEKGRIYPAGKQASALTDGFIKRLSCGNTKIMLSTVVEEIEEGFTLTLSGGEKLRAKYAVICSGGSAQPVCKQASPYKLAEDFGHGKTKLYPSLVQLKTDTKYIKTLKGIRADCAVSAICGGEVLKKVRGDVIFTEYGVSGNAVFSLSSYIADKQGAQLKIEFLPDFTAETIEENIRLKKSLNYAETELLSGTLHNQLGRAIIRRASSSNEKIIVETLKNFTLNVEGTLGFAYAQVTKGGIKMNEITDELESKIVKNLFFAGEILDVDGDCGGYNLQWAFTSGIAVAEAILKRV